MKLFNYTLIINKLLYRVFNQLREIYLNSTIYDKKISSKNKIKTSTKLIDGTPVNSIIDYAKDNSIIILGVSPKNSIIYQKSDLR